MIVDCPNEEERHQTETNAYCQCGPRHSEKLRENQRNDCHTHCSHGGDSQTNFWPAHPGDRRGDRPEAAQSARPSQKDECDFISADGSRTEDDTKDRSPKEDESRSQDAHNGH